MRTGQEIPLTRFAAALILDMKYSNSEQHRRFHTRKVKNLPPRVPLRFIGKGSCQCANTGDSELPMCMRMSV